MAPIAVDDSVISNGGERENMPSHPTLLLESNVLHRSLHEQPKKVAHAFGMYLNLDIGQKILDATGGAAVACLGHNHPQVKKAVAAQMNNFFLLLLSILQLSCW